MNGANTSQSSQKKVCGLFYPPWDGSLRRNRDRLKGHSQCACRAKIYMSVGQAALGADAAFESSSPTSQRYSCPSSQCLHANTGGDERWKSAPCTCRQAGGQGKKGWEKRETTEWEKEKREAAREEEEYKIGWWSQTETARESRGHLPPSQWVLSTQSVRGVSVTERTLKKVGFSRAQK